MKSNLINVLFNIKYRWVMMLAGCIAAGACGNNSSVKDDRDTLTSGVINISVDESFRPVIDSQIQVFESQNSNAKIVVHYKPEADCLRDLNIDSIRMVVVTRGLTEDEQKSFKEKLTFVPSFGILAYDAIAVITNSKSKDTVFTMKDVRGLVKGISGLKYKVVMDGNNSTSTVRFVVDSLLKGEKMGGNVQGAPGSEAVISFISENADAVGLVGVSWIGNKDDPKQISFLEKVNILPIECRDCIGGPYVKPYQANIYNGRYPMIRPLYYVLKENYEGLGSGFRNFLIYEKGQKIFSRSYLLPARQRVEVKNIDISE